VEVNDQFVHVCVYPCLVVGLTKSPYERYNPPV
jgi:hypothetical protein